MSYGAASADPELQNARAAGDGPVRPVRRIAAHAFGGDEIGFYRAAASLPIVVTGAMPDEELVRGLSIDRLASELSGCVIKGYSRESGEREAVGADEFFRDFLGGRSRHNVVDHSVGETPLRARLKPPAFFRTNWVEDRTDLGISPLSFTISPARNFTPLHVDGYGMQGWMYLLRGLKHWTFVSPDDARPRMDPETGELPPDDPGTWRGVERHQVTARAGDLVFIPPGWGHQVLTPEVSLGVGGSVLNAYQIVPSMTSWLAERALGISDELDVASLARAAAPAIESPELRANLDRAFTLYVAWDRAMGDAR